MYCGEGGHGEGGTLTKRKQKKMLNIQKQELFLQLQGMKICSSLYSRGKRKEKEFLLLSIAKI